MQLVTPKLPSKRLDLLMVKAAELRAHGLTWASVGAQVNRSPETVRQWPRRYPERWQRYYRQAEDDLCMLGGAEATTVERSLLHTSQDEHIRLAAAKALDRKRENALFREHRTAQAASQQVPAEVVRFLTYLESLSNERVHELLLKLLAEYPLEPGLDHPDGLVPPGTVQPE
jgi:hypothetical protein